MSNNENTKPINGNAKVIVMLKDKLAELNREITDLTRRRDALINQAEGIRLAISLIEGDE